MEELLFYSYQDFLKKEKSSMGNRLRKIPISLYILFAIIALFGICGVILYFVPNTEVMRWVCFIIVILTCPVLYFYCESYFRKKSHDQMENYKAKSKKVLDWLEPYNLNSPTEIQEVRNRITAAVNLSEEKRSRQNQRFDKWMQILIIPIFLLVLSEVMKNQQDLTTAFTNIFNAILLFVLIYFLIYFFRSFGYLLEKLKSTQMKDFADALQGVLDTQFDGIEIKKYDMNR